MASMQGSLEYQSYYLNMLYFLKARIAIRKKLKTAESIYSVSNQHWMWQNDLLVLSH